MPSLLTSCPDCGELICPEANICRYCQSVDPFGKARRRDKARNIMAILFICGMSCRRMLPVPVIFLGEAPRYRLENALR